MCESWAQIYHSFQILFTFSLFYDQRWLKLHEFKCIIFSLGPVGHLCLGCRDLINTDFCRPHKHKCQAVVNGLHFKRLGSHQAVWGGTARRPSSPPKKRAFHVKGGNMTEVCRRSSVTQVSACVPVWTLVSAFPAQAAVPIQCGPAGTRGCDLLWPHSTVGNGHCSGFQSWTGAIRQPNEQEMKAPKQCHDYHFLKHNVTKRVLAIPFFSSERSIYWCQCL